ncbi:MAG: hypothetical protein AAGN35_21325 [Bacteroidota bacterium]
MAHCSSHNSPNKWNEKIIREANTGQAIEDNCRKRDDPDCGKFPNDAGIFFPPLPGGAGSIQPPS